LLATVLLGSGLRFVAMLFVAARVGGALLVAVTFRDKPVPSVETAALPDVFALGVIWL
jgi:hydrogenase/urease accessory protein HupE